MAQVKSFVRKNEPLETHYILGAELGSGAFSKVYTATCKATKEKRAVKIMHKNGQVKQVLQVENEIKCWSRLRHPSIVTLFEVYDTQSSFALVQELVTGGELFDHIVENSYYSETEASDMIRQITEGVRHCHKAGIIHRDLKPENLLCSDPGLHFRVLLADFGLASTLEDSRRLHKPVGTPGYIAPEVLAQIDNPNSPAVGTEVDVWSIGVILYVLLCGFPPFDIEDEARGLEEASNAQYDFPSDSAWDEISEAPKELIRSILVVDRTKRPTPDDILNHPWIKRGVPKGKHLTKTIEQLVRFNAKRKWKMAINATRALRRFAKKGADQAPAK